MRLMRGYIRWIDGMNWLIGRITMFGLFVLMGILLWSSVSKTFLLPSLWTLELAQFVMVAYYILGGPYSIQLGSNVRMDLIYAELNDRKKAWLDAFTVFFLLFYLGVMIYGGLASLAYSLGNFMGGPLPFFGRLIDLGDGEVGDADMASLAGLAHLAQGVEVVGHGHFVIG